MNEVIPVENQDDLSRVVRKALGQMEEILDIDPAQVEPEDYIKLLSVKKDAAASIINAGLKADENRFRRENKDIIEKLFEKIKNDARTIEHKRK
jgi:hypothetical protein